MKINTGELSLLLQEASALSNKANWTKQDEKRNAFLLTAISAVKAGASLQELEQENHNAESRAAGLPTTRFNRGFLSAERRSIAKEWQSAVEQRDMVGGNPISRIGSYSGLGYFVPTEFFPNVFSAMKASDPVMSDDDVTLLQSTNGRVLTVPILGDIANVALVIGESSADSSVDIGDVGQASVACIHLPHPAVHLLD